MERKVKNIIIRIDGNDLYYDEEVDNFEKERYPYDERSEDEQQSRGEYVRIEYNIVKVFHKAFDLVKKKKDDPFKPHDFELLGEMLSTILLGKMGVPRRKPIVTIIQTPDPTTRNRLYLEFKGNLEMACLPWEYTLLRWKPKSSDKYDKRFISASKDSSLHMVRRFDTMQTQPYEMEKLFVLVLQNYTAGEELPNDDIPSIEEIPQRDRIKVKKYFDELAEAHPGKIYFEIIDNPPAGGTFLDEVRAKLEIFKQKNNGEMPPYVLHYFGHSCIHDNSGQVALKGDNGACWFEAEKFASQFEKRVLQFPSPVMVCFQSCDSGKLMVLNAKLKGVGYEFIEKGIPAVIGIQNRIDIESSSQFYKQVYDSILKGHDVAEAVTIGRDYLGIEYCNSNLKGTYSSNDFGSPVLMINTREPICLMKQAPEPDDKERQNTTTTSDKASKGKVGANTQSLRNDSIQGEKKEDDPGLLKNTILNTTDLSFKNENK